jgi:cardiolipin synthase A/B
VVRRREPERSVVREHPETRTRSVGRILWRIAVWTLRVAVLFLALNGFLYLTEGPVVQHVLGAGADGPPVSSDDPEFPRSVAVLTGTQLTNGNLVALAQNGDETFPRLFADLRSAKRSITIQSYYGAEGTVADTLREILLERAAAGVRVLFLYDVIGTEDISEDDRLALRKSGVVVVPFRPLRPTTFHVMQNRSHVRSVVIDDRIGWTGGFGIDDKWLGDGIQRGAWRDTNVRFEGPAVEELRAVFAAAWTEATGVMPTGRSAGSKEADAGSDTGARDGGGSDGKAKDVGVAWAGLLHASPNIGNTAAERFLALSIAGAKRTLYVTNSYFAPEAHVVALLVGAATRGVDVRLLVGGTSTDVRAARFAGRASYEPLLEAGVRIYEWESSTLHAKSFVVDGAWSAIGTMNLDNRSLVLNDEVMLMVLDRAFGRRMDSVFLADLECAKEIDVERFAKRPWTDHVNEWWTELISKFL